MNWSRGSLDRAVTRWLAEEAGRPRIASDEAAEAALVEVFSRWPAPLPPAGFALAVLRRAGLVQRRDVFGSRWLHVAIAASFVLAAAAVAFLPAVGRLARLVFEPADLLELLSRGMVSASHMAAGALDVWGFLSRLGEALGAVVATPQAAGTLLVIALCAGGALRALDRLIAAERST